MFTRIREFSIYGMRRGQAFAFGSAMLGTTAVVDFVTPPDFSVTAFYIFSVLIVSWSCGRPWAFAFAVSTFLVQTGLGLIERPSSSSMVYFVMSNANRLFTFLLVVHLTTKLRVLYDRESHTARVDDLTGVKNRKGFREVLDAEIVRHRRNGKALCVLYIDCDDFKVINDRFGHGEGDKLLTSIALVALATVRRSDTVGRLGGDEFAVIFPETTGADALTVAHKLHAALGAIARKPSWPVTFSFGVGSFSVMPVSADEAMKFADSVMYQAKDAGKDRTYWADFRDGGPARDAAFVAAPAHVPRAA
jgi:diguanylate cyclase (GGDEF)-like protein